MMSDLPIERLGYRHWLFSNCVVEYFDPFFGTIHRSSEFRWAFLFTCMTTRAVHIKIVPSMDTGSWVMVIERFVARCRTPSVVWSDNYTNFVGAEKEVMLCVQSWNRQAPALLVHMGTKLKYNPPGALHPGGF